MQRFTGATVEACFAESTGSHESKPRSALRTVSLATRFFGGALSLSLRSKSSPGLVVNPVRMPARADDGVPPSPAAERALAPPPLALTRDTPTMADALPTIAPPPDGE